MKHNQTNVAITVSRDTLIATVRRLLRTGHDAEAEAIASVLPVGGPPLTEAEAVRLDHLAVDSQTMYGLAAAAMDGLPIFVIG